MYSGRLNLFNIFSKKTNKQIFCHVLTIFVFQVLRKNVHKYFKNYKYPLVFAQSAKIARKIIKMNSYNDINILCNILN